MVNVRKLVGTSFLALFLSYDVSAQDAPLSTRNILVVGKMTGACGILDSMIQFQKTTRMSDGDAFVLRFWEVEAARLGMSVEQLSNQCNQSINAYGKLWDESE